MPMQIHNYVFNALSVAVSLVFSLVLFEVGVRFLFPAPSTVIDKEFDPQRGWRYLPGIYYEKPRNALVSHEILICDRGLRVHPTKGEASDADVNVVVLGDSFTFARAVPSESIYTTVLGELLSKSAPNRVAILNAGVEGYGTAQQLYLMKDLVEFGVRPDIYILQMFTNDILDNLRRNYSTLEIQPLQPGFAVDADGRLFLEARPDQSKHLPMERHTAGRIRSLEVLYSAADSMAKNNPWIVTLAARAGFSIDASRTPGVISGWYTEELLETGRNVTKALLTKKKELAEDQGAHLLVVAIPSPLSVYDEVYDPMLRASHSHDDRIEKFFSDRTRSQRIYGEIAGEIGIPYLDLYPIFLEQKTPSLYIPREGHLSQQGHRVLAKAIAGWPEFQDVLIQGATQ